jgi:hypothetical protein
MSRPDTFHDTFHVSLMAEKSGVKNVEELFAVLFGPRRW